MAGAIRLTKAEREYIRWLVETGSVRTGKDLPVADSILEKLEKSELVKGKGRAPGLGYPVIMEALRAGLGDRLIEPRGAFVGMLMNRVRLLNLTPAELTQCAQAAAVEWRGPVKAQSVVNNAERFLRDGARPTGPAPHRQPLGMED